MRNQVPELALSPPKRDPAGADPGEKYLEAGAHSLRNQSPTMSALYSSSNCSQAGAPLSNEDQSIDNPRVVPYVLVTYL